jgi:hypothetical protein
VLEAGLTPPLARPPTKSRPTLQSILSHNDVWMTGLVIKWMLTGQPCTTADEAERKSGDFPSCYSNGIRQLVHRMLSPKKDRITAVQVCLHPSLMTLSVTFVDNMCCRHAI